MPTHNDPSSNPEEPQKLFDKVIQELIEKRKIQRDALLKIKASVAKRQSGGSSDASNSGTPSTPAKPII